MRIYEWKLLEYESRKLEDDSIHQYKLPCGNPSDITENQFPPRSLLQIYVSNGNFLLFTSSLITTYFT